MPKTDGVICRGLAAALLTLVVPAPASAQIWEVARSAGSGAGFAAGSAYDPVHDYYFVVSAEADGVKGRFVNRAGVALHTIMLDTRRADWVVRTAYSAEISDGAGGFGAFLVIWTLPQTPGLMVRRASLPAGAVGPIVTIPVNGPGGITKGDIAYSPRDRIFLIGLGWLFFASGRGLFATTVVTVDLDLQRRNEITLVGSSHSCANIEFQISCNEVRVAWNPVSGEFGVLHDQDSEQMLARVSASGTVFDRIALPIPSPGGALAVDPVSGNYLAVSGGLEGTWASSETAATEIAADGTVVARAVVTSALQTLVGANVIQLAHSPASGTFLLTGFKWDGGGLLLELNRHGVPLGSTVTLPSTPMVVGSHPTAPEWLVTTAVSNSIIETGTRFGGSDARLNGCLTPDPFVALGGGTCYNGGWLPPGMPIPTPDAPAPPPAGCATPDPFVAFGGGTCVNGGWLPPGMPIPTTPTVPPDDPAPPPTGCATPDPFVALGGGTCVNGGWLPPGMPVPAPPPSCVTPDPFVAMGGGVCIDGGWRPRG